MLAMGIRGATGTTPLGLIGSLNGVDPGLQVPLQEIIGYDRFYLADHVMYGSSRLGLKNITRPQYKYE